MKNLLNIKGFTLIEIMITVSIILILTSIGVPIYKGYLTDARIKLARQNLNSIYLAESNYFFENNEFYYSGSACGDHNNSITNTLFHGEKIISTDNFTFCITKTNNGYKALASQITGNIKAIINNLNNFSININILNE